MTKDFIKIGDFDGRHIETMLRRAIADKARFRAGKLPATLQGKTLAMVFEKPSLRTRVSFEAAMTQLGGHAIYLAPADIGLSTREPIQDIARVLGRMCDAVVARTFSHEMVQGLARCAPVPVINALTDHCHPCQAMADLMTMMEVFGELSGKTIAFVGDGNNVARSLAAASARLGMKFILAAPEGYELTEAFVSTLADSNCYVLTHKPTEAVAQADVVYADTWVSMGQEDQKRERLKDFDGFQVNADLMGTAPKKAIVLHCLPAYRGYEITEDIFEAHADSIFRQAENRLHFQRSLLNMLLAEGGIH